MKIFGFESIIEIQKNRFFKYSFANTHYETVRAESMRICGFGSFRSFQISQSFNFFEICQNDSFFHCPRKNAILASVRKRARGQKRKISQIRWTIFQCPKSLVKYSIKIIIYDFVSCSSNRIQIFACFTPSHIQNVCTDIQFIEKKTKVSLP